MSDYDLSSLGSQELIDMKDKITTILNFGKYSSQILTGYPTWKGREGESVYAYTPDSGSGYNFYIFFWLNSSWVYMQWLSAATSLFYQATSSIPFWSAVIDPIIAISDRSITSIRIALGAIGSDNIAVNSIFTEALSTGAVTATKIGSSAIITGHLSANAVTATAISSGAITTDKILANAITSVKIAANSIIAQHLTTGTVVISETAQIQDAIITDAKIGSLTVNKLTAGSIAAFTLTMSSSGAIQSDNYSANISGYKLDSSGLAVWTGTIKGSVLEGAGIRNQEFTSGGTFTVPTGITKVFATLVSGGGGGSTTYGGGGAGGGCIINYPITVVAGSGYLVVLGSAGASGSPGTDGTATTFAGVSAAGGGGGQNGAVGSPGRGGICRGWGVSTTGSEAEGGGSIVGVGGVAGGGNASGYGGGGGGRDGSPAGNGTNGWAIIMW